MKAMLGKLLGKVRQLDLFSAEPSPPPEPVLFTPPVTHKAPKMHGVAPALAPLGDESERVPPGMQVVYAPRLRKGWRVEWRAIGGGSVTLPRYMQAAEFLSVRNLVYDWAMLIRKRKTTAVKAEVKALEKRIWSELEERLLAQGKQGMIRGERIPPIRTKGRVHDLAPHFNWLNEHYFSGSLECLVTWAGRVGGLSFHSQRRDPKTGQKVELVSISRGYDLENCPVECLRGILYHECLHIAVPPQQRRVRRVVHGAEFRKREKQFEHYEQWKRWHAEVLPKNVRALQREAKRRSKEGK